jgi:hypothetical protein
MAGQTGPMPGNLGGALPQMPNAGMAGAMMARAPSAAPNANGGMLGSIMSQLHPQAQQALRGIPRETMQHLHNAGLIHPGLMDHFHGGAMR